MQTSRCVAGIDVHKKMLAVVVGRTREQSLQLERGSSAPRPSTWSC